MAGLAERGIRTVTVWECAMRGPGRHSDDELGLELAEIIRSPSREPAEIAGNA